MKLTALVFAFLASIPQNTSPQEKPAEAQATTLAPERHELAEIQLLLGAEREYAKAKERLAKLAESLSARTGKEAKTLLGEVELLERKVRRALGEAVPDEFSLLVDVVTGQLSDKVEEAVLAAIQREDFAFVRELGARAVPGLVRAVRAEVDVFPSDKEKDPLWHLSRIHALAASQLAGELLEETGFLWKKRVIRVMDPSVVWQKASLWTAGSPRRWLGEGFSRTAERLLEDPDVGVEALLFLGTLARQGGERAARFDASLGRALRSAAPRERAVAKDWAGKNPDVVGLDAFVALLGESEDDLRSFAAEVLVERFPADRSVLARGNDPDPLVRRLVAEWLGQSDEAHWREEGREVLASLLLDPDENVRKAAWSALANMDTTERSVTLGEEDLFSDRPRTVAFQIFRAPLPDEVYLSLLESNPVRRVELCNLAGKLAPPLRDRLYEALAADEEPSVVQEVTSQLNVRWPELGDPAAALRLASTLLENPAQEDSHRVLRLAGSLSETRSGLDAFARWALARPDEGALRELIRRMDDGDGVFRRLSQLEPALVRASLARVFTLDRDAVAKLIHGDDLVWTPALAAALRDLARDRAQPIELRVLALHASLQSAGAEQEHREIALAILDEPAWRDWVTARAATDALRELVDERKEGLANAVVLRTLRDPVLPREVPATLAPEFSASDEGAPEIVALVTARWPGEIWLRPVRSVLGAMRRVPALQDPEFLARAARDGALAGDAFQVMGVLADPRYLPLLAEVVKKPASTEELEHAARALTGYLDEGAVEPLLVAAAKVQSNELRDGCLAHLEKIRKYLDARERWAAGKVTTETRAQVIAQLVAQLAAKSDEVKVQAIRALATWEAVETMPRLIELTASGSKSVAAAAREALERLNQRAQD